MKEKDIKINIVTASFPNQMATDAEKESPEYGLQVGNAIQYEWMRKDGQGCRFYNQWGDFHRIRLYARGEQPVQKYKNELAINGDLSYLNLDWTPVPIMSKFIDVVVNGMCERLFKVKAYSQDALSQKKRSQFQDMIEGQMAAKDVLLNIQDKTGIDPFVIPPDELPSSDEELALFMNLKYKPAIEIAEETAIETIFDENHFQDTQKRIAYDIATIGIGFGKHEFLLGSGVEISYVDPANLVYSYTEDPYFKDCFYFGEVKTVPITEIKKIKPDISKEELEIISEYGAAWFDYYNLAQYYNNSLFGQDVTTLLYFNYKTTKKVVYKKKITEYGAKMIQKDDSFNPPDKMMEGKFEKKEKTIDVWYEGVMVLGANILIKWHLAENMVRPKSSSQHAISNYIGCAPRMYKGVIDSLARKMIPFADGIQIVHLKLQQVINRTVPDGVFIDADGLNEVDLGNGASYNPEEALRLYFQTGSVVGRSLTQEGDFNHAKIPIQQLNSNSGANKISTLISTYNQYLSMIRDVTGLNEARDGSMPDPNSLVGLQKLAALNSNVATRHILDGLLSICRGLSEAITYRVADIMMYSDFKDDFANKIGKYNMSILEEIKSLYIYDFGIFIELEPDEQEKAQLEANIQMALSKGDIYLEDAIDIREIRNIKLANQLLKQKRRKKLEREEKMQMQQQAIVSQQNIQSQQIAAQMSVEKTKVEGAMKIQIIDRQGQWEKDKLQTEAELKSQLMQLEFNYNMQLAGINEKITMQQDKIKEDGKINRISKQNSQQSMLINQRKNNLPPINFESNEDSLDGLGMQQFEPR